MTKRTAELWLVGMIVAVALSMAAALNVALSRRGHEYVYVEDLARHISYKRGEDLFWCGKLDRAGNFLPLSSAMSRAGIGFYGYPCELVNEPSAHGQMASETEIAYEFRSGYLILGVLNSIGDFVPMEGSAVLRLAEYRYSPEAPRIYNLPGRFVKKRTAEER